MRPNGLRGRICRTKVRNRPATCLQESLPPGISRAEAGNRTRQQEQVSRLQKHAARSKQSTAAAPATRRKSTDPDVFCPAGIRNHPCDPPQRRPLLPGWKPELPLRPPQRHPPGRNPELLLPAADCKRCSGENQQCRNFGILIAHRPAWEQKFSNGSNNTTTWIGRCCTCGSSRAA